MGRMRGAVLGLVEVVGIDTYSGDEGKGSGGGAAVVAKQGDGLGTTAGIVGIYVGCGSHDNFVTATEVASPAGEVGEMACGEGDGNGENSASIGGEVTPCGVCVISCEGLCSLISGSSVVMKGPGGGGSQ